MWSTWSSTTNRFPLDTFSNKKCKRDKSTYLSRKLRRFSSSPQINTISSNSSKRFLLKSSSAILGHVSLIVFPGFSAHLIRAPSTMTIFNSRSWASCCRILSNPISSTSLPEISMLLSTACCLMAPTAYFSWTASTKLWTGSGSLLSGKKDAAHVEERRPVFSFRLLGVYRFVIFGDLHLKYLTPSNEPSFLPRVASSHSTPIHVLSSLPFNFPIHRTVHLAFLKATRWFTWYLSGIACCCGFVAALVEEAERRGKRPRETFCRHY